MGFCLGEDGIVDDGRVSRWSFWLLGCFRDQTTLFALSSSRRSNRPVKASLLAKGYGVSSVLLSASRESASVLCFAFAEHGRRRMLDRQTSGTHASLRSDRAHWSLEGEEMCEHALVEYRVTLSKAKTDYQELDQGVGIGLVGPSIKEPYRKIDPLCVFGEKGRAVDCLKVRRQPWPRPPRVSLRRVLRASPHNQPRTRRDPSMVTRVRQGTRGVARAEVWPSSRSRQG
ncbi:hypothetical protein QBC37DRAFT_4172 [Rhypophila decipiens]|uniref:Uncharacterized protein n=1 Tax=Rhypophila decipiens TaxID=261697 RepID=A0AAN6YP29_9PEZI|nr:hypothetical protein QBC37DRAFT_4172 [Rhypophila decipiens]